MTKRYTIRARRLPDGIWQTVVGRDAWALEQLMSAGKDGCTPITHVGPRWSHYVFKLRRAGFAIETVEEPHDGPFSGHHARYVLHDSVEVAREDAKEAA